MGGYGSGGHNKLPEGMRKARNLQGNRAVKVRPAALPVPPSDLSEAEKAVWLRLAPEVDALGVAGVPDVEAFTLLVVQVAHARKVSRLVDVSPSAVTNAIKAANAALAAFGLTPAGRARLDAPTALPDAQDGRPDYGALMAPPAPVK